METEPPGLTVLGVAFTRTQLPEVATVGVADGEGVAVGATTVAVPVGVEVAVAVGVRVAVAMGVRVDVAVGVAVAGAPPEGSGRTPAA